MKQPTLEPGLADSLRKAAHEVLAVATGCAPRAVAHRGRRGPAREGEAIGRLEFRGTRSGAFVLVTDAATARTLVARMLQSPPSELPDLATTADGLGELVNLIAGSCKHAWLAGGDRRMELSPPQVLLHDGARSGTAAAALPAGGIGACFRVDSEHGSFDLGVCFEPER